MAERNEDEKERLAKLNRLSQMWQEAMDIRDRLMSSDTEAVKVAEKDMERLLEQFYEENKDMMAPQQHEAAKKEFGYLVALIEMAIGHYSPKGQYVKSACLH
jgi:hypothetical protein